MDKSRRVYEMKYYDTKMYESRCFYYNIIERIKPYVYKKSDDLKNHLIGFTEQFLSLGVGSISVKQRYIVKEIYKIHTSLMNQTTNSLLRCNLKITYQLYTKTRKLKNNLTKEQAIDRVENEFKHILKFIDYKKNAFKN